MMKKINVLLILLSIGLLSSCSSAGKIENYDDDSIKLTKVNYVVPVSVSEEKAWEVLASYGNVSNFHSGVKSSKAINGTSSKATLGSNRVCYLEDGKKEIMVKEEIIKFNDNSSYTYIVHEWDNFPLQKVVNTFGVKKDQSGQVYIYQEINFRLSPGMLTGIMKGKMANSARDALLAYKHYMETGIKNDDWDTIKEKYKNL